MSFKNRTLTSQGTLDMNRGLVSGPKMQLIHGRVSEREAEISLLEEKMLEMDHEADQDISQHWYYTGRSLRPTQRRKQGWMKETTDDVAIRIARLLEEQEPTRRKLQSLRRANQLSRASIASIRKIPNEVLSLIFQEYVDMNRSVWDLVDVCEQWKQVAFVTPHLWSTITIGDYTRHGEERDHSGRNHLCIEPRHLNAILGRSASASLDIIVMDKLTRGNLGEFIRCLKLLNSPNVISRVKSLVIRVESSELMGAYPDCFHAAPFTRLEALDLASFASQTWHENILSSISRTTRLQTFKSVCRADTIDSPGHIWLRVKVLELSYAISSRGVNEVVSKCSLLEEFTCRSYCWPDSNTPRIALSNLLRASLICIPSSLRLLQMPVIRDLQVTHPTFSFSPSPGLEFTAYPELRSLEIDSANPDQWLTNVSMDKLDYLKLIIRGELMNASVLSGTSLGTFTALRALYIEAGVDESFTMGFLDLLPGLASFVFVPSRYPRSYYSKKYGLKLLPHLSEYDERFLCVPNLRELTLGGPGGKGIRTPKRTLLPQITQLIESRAMHDASLLKLEILWYNGRTIQKFIY